MVEEGICAEVIAEVCQQVLVSDSDQIASSLKACETHGTFAASPVESGALPSSSETLGVPFGSLSVSIFFDCLNLDLHSACFWQ